MSYIAERLRLHLTTRAGYLLLGVGLLLILMPSFIRNLFFVNAVMLVFMYAVISLAWNLMNGYTGLLSFSHSVYFGVGAYTVMLLLYRGLTPWVGMIAGGVVAGILGFALGIPFSRLRSHWFTLGTLVLGDIFLLVFQNWKAVGGALGLDMPRSIFLAPPSLYWMNFASPTPYYYLALGILAGELLAMFAILNSKLGYYLQAIREDEEAAKASGIDTTLYKSLSMGISGFFTGIAGGIYTLRFSYIDPFAVFSIMRIAVYPVIAGLIGGVYSLVGPVIGSFIFIPIAEYVRAMIGGRLGPRFYGIHLVFFGVILLIISLRAPEGVMGWIQGRGLLKPLLGEKSLKGVGSTAHPSSKETSREASTS
jgi:branched-chain amino acid transport system permease protein